MYKAPIVLFVYNRLSHTQLTVEALLRNSGASESQLFIFSDAAKNKSVIDAVNQVRAYIKSITGFKSISIIERVENFGLARSIIDGVTQVCSEYGKVIVLEDDLVTSPYFLQFMNESLNLYNNDDRIISIHGYIYPVKAKLPETFFLRGADCWGWATWKRGWDLFESDGRKLLETLKKNQLESEFNFGGSYDYLGMLDSQVNGKNDSWAIRWYASAFLANKLTLYPGKSLVLNIGNDDSGTHCGTTEIFSGDIIDRPVVVGGISIRESLEGRSAVTKYFSANKSSILQRVIQQTGSFGERLLRWGRRS